MCSHVGVCIRMCTGRDQKFMSSILFYRPHLTLSVGLMHTDCFPSWPASKLWGPACLCLPPQSWAYRHVLPLLAFHLGAKDLKSDPHERALYSHQRIDVSSLWIVCLIQIKYAVPDPSREPFLTSIVEKLPVFPKRKKKEFYKPGMFCVLIETGVEKPELPPQAPRPPSLVLTVGLGLPHH